MNIPAIVVSHHDREATHTFASLEHGFINLGVVNEQTTAKISEKFEKLGYIYSAKEWINLRKIRNNISHQYDDEPDGMSLAINEIVAIKEVLLKIYANVKARYEELFSVNSKSR